MKKYGKIETWHFDLWLGCCRTTEVSKENDKKSVYWTRNQSHNFILPSEPHEREWRVESN
jgi:hypothetical protein